MVPVSVFTGRRGNEWKEEEEKLSAGRRALWVMYFRKRHVYGV